MSVTKRGDRYHYRFQIEGKRYHGVCTDCQSKRQATEYERRIKGEVSKVHSQKNVVALVENYRRELTGCGDIPLEQALAIAEAKPRRRKPSASRLAIKATYWRDFVGFMADRFPAVVHLAAVRRQHCESYINYLAHHGRFTDKTGYGIATKTLKEIISVCRGVFAKLKEDAGIVYLPFEGIELPAARTVSREIFTADELMLIRDGLETDEFCRPLFRVAALTGLTEGDICTLKWDELQVAADGQLYIRRLRRKTQVALEIPVLPALRDFFATIPRVSAYVFPEHADLYLKTPTNVSRKVIRFLRNLGIETRYQSEGLRAVSIKDLHSMRHVFCYYAGQAGIPLSTVQSIAGHMTPEMTKLYMSHTTLRDKAEAMQRLPALLTFADYTEQKAPTPRDRLLSIVQGLPDAEVDALLAQLCG